MVRGVLVLSLSVLCLQTPVSRAAQAAQVDQIELQWVVCEPDAASALRKLKAPAAAQRPAVQRSVYYLETPALALRKAGYSARVRSKGRERAGRSGAYKVTLKFKLRSESEIPWDYLVDKDHKCEYDAYAGGRRVLGCSLHREVDGRAEGEPLERPYLSKRQRELVEWDLGRDVGPELLLLGPLQNEVYEWQQTLGLGSFELTLDSVASAGEAPSLELSTRVKLDERAAGERALSAWIKTSSVTLCPAQTGKTAALVDRLLSKRNRRSPRLQR